MGRSLGVDCESDGVRSSFPRISTMIVMGLLNERKTYAEGYSLQLL